MKARVQFNVHPPSTWALVRERVTWWFEGLYLINLSPNRRTYMAKFSRRRIKEDPQGLGPWGFNAIEQALYIHGLPCLTSLGLILLADQEEHYYLMALLERTAQGRERVVLRFYMVNALKVRSWSFYENHSWPLILATWRRLPRRPPWKRALRDYHHHRELLVPLLLAHDQHNL